MWYQKSGNKYHAKSTIYNGRSYHSKLEAGVAEELDWRLKAKDIKSWKPQIPIELRVNGELICKYYVDFEVENNDGVIEWIEAKGFETEIYRLKAKLLEAIYKKEFESGEKIYTVIKQTSWQYFKQNYKK